MIKIDALICTGLIVFMSSALSGCGTFCGPMSKQANQGGHNLPLQNVKEHGLSPRSSAGPAEPLNGTWTRGCELAEEHSPSPSYEKVAYTFASGTVAASSEKFDDDSECGHPLSRTVFTGSYELGPVHPEGARDLDVHFTKVEVTVFDERHLVYYKDWLARCGIEIRLNQATDVSACPGDNGPLTTSVYSVLKVEGGLLFLGDAQDEEAHDSPDTRIVDLDLERSWWRLEETVGTL